MSIEKKGRMLGRYCMGGVRTAHAAVRTVEYPSLGAKHRLVRQEVFDLRPYRQETNSYP